jgi:WD40 repeat protein
MVIAKWFVLLLAASISLPAKAQSVAGFSAPKFVLSDAKHKQEKSGVHLGPGNLITIVSGRGTPTSINILAFSKNGNFLAAGKDFGRVVVWDLRNRKFVCALVTGAGIVTAVALSTDGQWLVTAGQNDGFRAKLWHLPDAKLVRTYDYFQAYLHTLAFGPDGSWIIAWSNDSKVHVLDATRDKQLLELDGVFSPLLSSDGRTLMTVGRTEFTVWTTSDWSKQRSLPRPADFPVPLALNSRADTFVVASSGEFRLMRLSTGALLPNSPKPELPKFNPSAGGFAAFREGTPLLFGHSDDRLWVWNSETGQTCVSEMMYSESGTLSADGSLLAGAKDNSILAQSQSSTGVWVWDTDELVLKCLGAAEKFSVPAR